MRRKDKREGEMEGGERGEKKRKKRGERNP